MNRPTIRIGELSVLLLAAACTFALPGCATSGWKDPVAAAPRLTIENAGQHIRSIVYSSDGSRLLVGQWPRPRIWDARTGMEGPILEGYDEPRRYQEQENRPAAFSPDDKVVAAASYGEVVLIDSDSGKLRAKFEVSSSPNQALAFSKDGSRLLWAGEVEHGFFSFSAPEVEARAWNLATNELEWTERIRHAESPRLSPDGMSLAYFRRAGWFQSDEVHVWDVPARGERSVMKVGWVSHNGVRLGLSPDDSLLSVSERSGTHIRMTADGSRHRVLRDVLWGSLRTGFAFSPEGSFVAGGGSDGSVKLWDETTGEASRALVDPQLGMGLRPSPDPLAFSPDGRFLAAAMSDRRIRIWEVSQFLELSDARTRPGAFTSEATPDGR